LIVTTGVTLRRRESPASLNQRWCPAAEIVLDRRLIGRCVAISGACGVDFDVATLFSA